MTALAQSPSDTSHSPKQIIYLLPDGSIIKPEKLDSLSKAWGKGRIMFRHNQEDDANGTMFLVRMTDAMKQKFDADRIKTNKALQQ